MGGGNQIYLESKTDQIFSSNIFWSEIILRQENEWWGRHFPIFRFTLSLTHRAVYPTEGGPTWTSITELTLLLAIRSFQGEAGISTCSSDPVEGGDKVVYKFSKVGGKYGEDGSQLVTAHIFCPSSELEKSCQGKFPSEVLHFHLISLSSSDHG